MNFTQYGLQINAGHEVMMDRVWMGETNFDFDHEKLGSRPNATAIQVNPTVQTQLPTVHWCGHGAAMVRPWCGRQSQGEGEEGVQCTDRTIPPGNTTYIIPVSA